MAGSDSMYKFEVILEDVDCFMNCKKFYLRCDFADVFSMYLKNPNLHTKPPVPKIRKTKGNVKRSSTINKNFNVCPNNIDYKQEVVINCSYESLRENMRVFPLELTVIARKNQQLQSGSIQIPWKHIYLDFLDSIYMKYTPCDIMDKGKYNLYDDVTSKHVAIVSLQIKLSFLGINTLRIQSDENKSANITYNLNPSTYISTTMDALEEVIANPGVIKTKYRGRDLQAYIERKRKNILKSKSKDNDTALNMEVKGSIASICTTGHKSSALSNYFLNYDDETLCQNQVYCVGYCTVENKFENDLENATSPQSGGSSQKSNADNDLVERYKLKICDSECPIIKQGSCTQSICSLDLPEEARPLITVKKCKDVTCNDKTYRKLPTPVNSKILVNIHKNPCCLPADDNVEKVEQVVVGGAMTAKVDVGGEPCYCACECTFGFFKKTTYCSVCGGYEEKGKELAGTLISAMPHPCPLYHKLLDNKKSKSQLSTSGSGSKKNIKSDRSKSLAGTPKESEVKDEKKPDKGTIKQLGGKEVARKSNTGKSGKDVDKKSIESERDNKSGKKSKTNKDDRFKFNYGYQGIPPHIGHSKCAFPCQGTLIGAGINVPKTMGWLWTAEDVPGMKFRANWKPGAANKRVVRLLKCAKNPEEVLSKKKRRKESSKRKKNDKRPLLIVHKKEGEYNVTMETMKLYQKPRTLNQYPYEDKPVLTYTIGRTDEENRERTKKKERMQRRLERAQREFIQGSFKNMCEEICLKTYEQALGMLPGTEDPDCTCFPAVPDPEKFNLDRSCSCSEDNVSLDTETDSDEWFVEFTPPNAKFDPTFKPKKIIKVDNSSQYTYLDYRVKLLDRLGNPVQRFFKGPNGKDECSDLGGFWGPGKKWLEINVDGYVAPDGRWAPNTFIGPDNDMVDAETGKFQTANGNLLVVGVDGYVDPQGKWKFYRRGNAQIRNVEPKTAANKRQGGAGDRKEAKATKKLDKSKEVVKKKSTTTWSCFGDNISPIYLSEMGIVGHGHDKETLNKTLKDMLARGEKVTIPKLQEVPKSPTSRNKRHGVKGSRSYFENRVKCHHAVPTDKGITAIDDDGNKTYFKLRNYKNRRPSERIHTLQDQGISLSSFHLPCLHSFINSEIMKKQQRDRIFALAAKHVATQVSHD